MPAVLARGRRRPVRFEHPDDLGAEQGDTATAPLPPAGLADELGDEAVCWFLAHLAQAPGLLKAARRS